MKNLSDTLYKRMRELKDSALAEIRTLTNNSFFDLGENGFEDDSHNDVEATDGHMVRHNGGKDYPIEDMNLSELLLLLSTIEEIKGEQVAQSPVQLTDTAPFEPYDTEASQQF